MAFGLERLRIRRFRNIEEVILSPSVGLNLIHGRNAQGKTSILESIHLLSTGRILRGSRDSEAISLGSEGFAVDGTVFETGTDIGVELNVGKRKRALLNGVGLPRASDLIGRLPSVCFWAGDLALANGTPSDRRLFLDSELCQLYPAYLKALSTYKRALDQRNALLKAAQERSVAPEQFEVWEEQMGPSGEALRRFRQDWVTLVNAEAGHSQEVLGAGESLALDYVVKDELEGELMEKLAESRRVDTYRGSTSVGPHRDDVEIMVDGKSVRTFGSQGQQRTSVISIKLAVLEVARETLGSPPVLLLDDIFSDLDEGRRSRLVKVAEQLGGQVFLTCTEVGQAGGELVGMAQVIRVDSGTVEVE